MLSCVPTRTYGRSRVVALFFTPGGAPTTCVTMTTTTTTAAQILAGKENKKLSSGEQFLAGFGAGVLEAIFAVTPIETVKTKAIQTNSPFMQGVRTILKNEGPAGLYQGVWATIAKQGSNQVRACLCVFGSVGALWRGAGV